MENRTAGGHDGTENVTEGVKTERKTVGDQDRTEDGTEYQGGTENGT